MDDHNVGQNNLDRHDSVVLQDIAKKHNRKFKKGLKIIVFGVAVVFVLMFVIKGQLFTIVQMTIGKKLMLNSVKKYENRYKNDTYGAETPEGTYQLFLEALKKKDIDLAVKYFLFEEQEKQKQQLISIEKTGEWNNMMEDLLNSKNQKGIENGKNMYTINIYNNNNELVTQAVLRKPTSPLGQQDPIKNIGKMGEF